MTEKSMLWATGATGDGTTGYTEAETSRMFRHLTGVSDTGSRGILKNVLNELEPTGTSSPVAINTGSAFGYGFFYWNDASLNVAISTPSIGTTGHRIVLRVTWSTKQARITLLSSSDGVATIPSITQSAGSTWDIPICSLTITTGGVIAVTDERQFLRFATEISSANMATDSVLADAIAAGAVGNTEIRDSAGLSVIGRGANTSGDVADITAGTDGYVLRRSGTTLAFGQIAAGAIPNGIITNAMIRDSAALSVLGRASNSTGDIADISSDADEQVLLRYGTILDFGKITTGMIQDNQVDNTKLRNSSPVSVIGRAANSTGDPADIAAASDGEVLRRASSVVGFGQIATAGITDLAVTTAKIDNDAVDDTKAGNRVPKLTRRKGSSSTDWASSGTTSYTPTAVTIQVGSTSVTIASGQYRAQGSVSFPLSFTYRPVVFLTNLNTVTPTTRNFVAEVEDLTTSGFDWVLTEADHATEGTARAYNIMWMAVGQL